jgi:hypothetical protein
MQSVRGAGVRLLALFLVVVLGAYSHHARHTRWNQGIRCDLPWTDWAAPTPWTADLSVWGQRTDSARRPARLPTVGYFPLGNGQLYAAEGAEQPPNAIDDLIGPGYQQRPTRGQVVTVLLRGGRPVPWETQEVCWLRHSGVVWTESRARDAVLQTYDFIAPDGPVLYRLCRLRRGPGAARLSLDLAFVFRKGEAAGDSRNPEVQFGQIAVRPGVWRSRALWQPRALLAAEIPARSSPVAQPGPALVVPLGRGGPDKLQTVLLFVAAGKGEAGRALVRKASAAPASTTALLACRDHWAQWLDGGCSLTCADARVSDLIEIQKQIIKVQQDAGGGYSPMDMYTNYWIRDANGPVRFMLRAGRAEEVKHSLDFFFRACARRAAIQMNCPLNAPLAPEGVQPDWSRAPVEQAETPSFVILQHYWYWKYTGDLDTIRRHYGMLRRCLLGQAVDERGRLPFDGDETYRFPGYRAFENHAPDAPTDYVSLELRSADSAFDYVSAAEGLAEMTRAVGRPAEAEDYAARARRVRAATEQTYWQPSQGFYAPAASEFTSERHQPPFANINLNPLWIGYASPQDERAAPNVLNALKWLWREDGTARMTPTFGYVTGMTPGMVLYSLAALDHPDAERALQGVVNAADAAGGYAEMLTPDNRPADQIWGQRRARPWEGGINVEAILYYLTGYGADVPGGRATFCPRMPAKWPAMKVTRIPWGAGYFDLSLDRVPRRQQYRLSFHGTGQPRVWLLVSLPDCTIRSVHVVPGTWLCHPERSEGSREGDHAETLRCAQGDRLVRRFGRVRFPMDVALRNGEECTVTVEYDPMPPGSAGVPPASPTGTPALRETHTPFPYDPPNLAGATDLLLTWNKNTAARYRQKLGAPLAVMDTTISFPTSLLEAALRTPTLRQLWLDVASYPGCFRRPEYWTQGPGAAALKRFRQRGGNVTPIPDPEPFVGHRRFQ